MKKASFALFILLILSAFTSSAQSGTKKTDPTGDGKFEAPYAPEGYTTGNMIVGFQDKKHTVNILLPESGYKIQGETVKFIGDSLLFQVFIDGAPIGILLKMDSSTAMSGKALAPDG